MSVDLSKLSASEKRALLTRLLAEKGQAPRVRPLSAAQRRMWFFEQLEPETAVLHLPLSLSLRGRLDRNALDRALARLIQRHETLRTGISVVAGEPRQLVSASIPAPVTTLDLSGLAPADAANALRARVDAVADTPFDLGHVPLWRAECIKLGELEHRLLVTLHHIIADGWSITLFARDLFNFYAAEAGSPVSALPPLSRQYGDISEQEATQDASRKHLDYWCSTLAGAPPVLDLATDASRPPRQTFRASAAERALDRDLAAAVKRLARESGTTLFVTLLAAFNVLLSRQSGMQDIVVGTPVSGRNRQDVEELIGLFINTVAIRTQFDLGASGADVIEATKRSALGAFAHQDVSFERVVDELRVARDPARTPVFQVLFNLLRFRPIDAHGVAGLEIGGEPSLDRSAKFDFTFYAVESADTVQLQVVYNADLFSPARIAELIDQYELILAALAASSETPVQAIDLVTNRARAFLPDPQAPLPRTWAGSVLSRVSDKASRAPDAVALEDAAGRLTYGELDSKSSRLARALEGRGVTAGDVVALAPLRDRSFAIAILGIWKAGAAFAVLDPAHPSARLQACLDIVRAVGVVASDGVDLGGLLVAETAWTMAVSELERDQWGVPGQLRQVEPDDVAYVAFTSGSTGQPKAIVGTHRPLSHFLEWHAREFDSADVFSLCSGLGHDPAIRDVLTPFWVGGRLIVPSQEDLLDPWRLGRWLARHEVSVSHMTPPLAEILASGQQPVPSLRYVFLGGDRVSYDLLRRLSPLLPNARFVNCYGATETPQIAASYTICQPVAEDTWGIVPLGVGIPDSQLLLLNRMDRLAGVGELAEIAVRTPYLAKGYLDQSDDGRDRFTRNPFGRESEDRLYKTGDLGRYRLDGAVEYCGRRDRQVKVRGYRIELADIEAAMRAVPGVGSAAVIAVDHEQVTQLRGFWAGDSDAALTSGLQGRLPSYMMPAQLVRVEALPLTANGKLDVAALAAMRVAGEAAPVRRGPSTPTERALSTVWRELLAIDGVDAEDSFFERGGHSLAAARLIARIDSEFGVQLPLRSVFEAPTLNGMAARIDSLTAGREEIEL